MTMIIDAMRIEGLAEVALMRLQTTVQATAAATLTLTVTSNGYYIFTGSTAGQIVKLGDATTYQVGHSYLIHNASTAVITVNNNANATIFTLAANERATIILLDITSAAGVWVYNITSNSTGGYWTLGGGALTWEDQSGNDLVLREAGFNSFIRHISSNGTLASPTAITSGQALGGTGYFGWNSGGVDSSAGVEFKAVASENHSPTAFGTDFVWSCVLNGTTSLLERMRLSNAGHLLLGTSTDNGIDDFQLARGATVNFPSLECFDDFDWTTLGSGTNPHSVVSVVANGGAVTVEGATTANDYFGRISVATGTTANSTGRANLDFFNSVNKIRLGAFRTFIETRVMIPTLSQGNPAFTVFSGFLDGNATGAPANGIYFSYTHNVNGGQWVGVTRSASTSTAVNSSIDVVANVWYKLRAEINAAGSSVSFYIDNVLIGTSTTNIPTANPVRPAFQIEKNSNTPNSRIVWADYVYWRVFR